MKNYIKGFIMLLIVGIMPLMAGCKTTDILSGYVQEYCNTPVTQRAITRASLATLTAPNKVAIQCASDATLTTRGGNNE